MILKFGDTPVPYTVSWSAEEKFEVRTCRFAGGQFAICQAVAPGQGKPLFGKPHAQRQREVIALDLCDLCARPLKNRTKVSLSHAGVRNNGAEGPAVMQVEPLLHRECATESMKFCPSLRRDIKQGSLNIRQVTRHRVQIAVMAPEYVRTLVPDYKSNRPALGHAKVELLGWKDRDMAWLGVDE